MLDYAYRVVEAKRWLGSNYLSNYADKLRNRFAEYVFFCCIVSSLFYLHVLRSPSSALVKARLAKSRVRPTDLLPCAEKLMLEYALHMVCTLLLPLLSLSS